MKKPLAIAGVLAMVLLSGTAAYADDEPKRAKPDYDGRGEAPATAGDGALWVPRVIFSPFYLVSEFVLRRPIGALITVAERNHWSATLIDAFTFDKDHKAGIVPTAFFDFGMNPSVGFYLFWDEALAKKNDVRLHGSYFGSDWLALAFADRIHVGKDSLVELDAAWVRRPDYVYYGSGPRTLEDNRSRYLSAKLDAGPRVDIEIVHGIRVRSKLAVKDVTFLDSHVFGDPSLDDRVAQGAFAAPSDFPRGYTEVYEHTELVLDSRPARPGSQTGVRAEGTFEYGAGLRPSTDSSWIKYGGSVAAYWDITQHERVVSLVATTEFADPVQGGTIPFTEQVSWGGVGALAGFLPGRLNGRSGAAMTLRYAWPIWTWLDGTMHAALGNVFDAGLKGFDTKLLRVSGGIGIRSNGSPDHQFEIVVGVGTETIDQGGKVDSFRLSFGGTHGF